MKHWFIFSIFLTVLLQCGAYQNKDLSNCDTIDNIPGPEDIDIQKGREERLIISSQDRRSFDPEGEALNRGAIYYVPLKGRYVPYEFELEQRDDYPFHPHGIHVTKHGSRDYLYVVNHATSRQHSVELFEIKQNSLYFLFRFRSFLLTSPNDVVGISRDEFYVTNDRGSSGSTGQWFETYLTLSLANVVHFRGGYWKVVANDMSFANGIQIDSSEQRIYVTATGDEEVVEFERTNTGLKKNREFYVPGGVDNLMWESDSLLTVTTHPSLFDFLRHKNDANVKSPTEIYRLNVNTGSYQKVYGNDGTQLSAGSVGVPVRGKIFIGQVFEPRVLYCNYP